MVFVSGTSLLLSVPPISLLSPSFYLYVCGALRENQHANEVLDRQAPVRLVFLISHDSEINKKGGVILRRPLKTKIPNNSMLGVRRACPKCPGSGDQEKIYLPVSVTWAHN